MAAVYVARRASEPPRKTEPLLRPAEHPTREPHRSELGTFLLEIGIAVVAAALFAMILSDRRKQKQLAALPAPKEVHRGEWSPYVAGALLGVVVAVSMAVFGHRLSGGGAYQQIAGGLGRELLPRSIYFREVLPRGSWELASVCGALLGAFAAARTGGTFRIKTMPDSGWTDAFGSSVAKRWAIGFAGAFLTEVAAGVAGGCTASLAVSGGAALSPGAFVFMAGMFAGGVPTALLVYRKVNAQ